MHNDICEFKREGDEIVIRLKGKLLEHDRLQPILRFIEWEAIRAKSELTEEKAAELAAEVDRAVWEKLKPLVLGD